MAAEPVRPRQPRTGLALPLLVALAAFAGLLALGTWQLQRKAWKESLISTLEGRLAAMPAALPPPARWSLLDREHDEFRRVKLRAALVPGAEALVYTSGSAFRGDVSGPGYWVFAPAQVTAGGTVVINRGFVPEGRQDPATRPGGEISGPVDMIGAMRWADPAGFFTPRGRPEKSLWFTRDPLAIAAGKGWGEVAPFFIELEAPEPPGGLPRPGALKVSLRNEHLQYAVTWYGLALVEAIMVLAWLRSRRPPAGHP